MIIDMAAALDRQILRLEQRVGDAIRKIERCGDFVQVADIVVEMNRDDQWAGKHLVPAEKRREYEHLLPIVCLLKQDFELARLVKYLGGIGSHDLAYKEDLFEKWGYPFGELPQGCDARAHWRIFEEDRAELKTALRTMEDLTPSSLEGVLPAYRKWFMHLPPFALDDPEYDMVRYDREREIWEAGAIEHRYDPSPAVRYATVKTTDAVYKEYYVSPSSQSSMWQPLSFLPIAMAQGRYEVVAETLFRLRHHVLPPAGAKKKVESYILRFAGSWVNLYESRLAARLEGDPEKRRNHAMQAIYWAVEAALQHTGFYAGSSQIHYIKPCDEIAAIYAEPDVLQGAEWSKFVKYFGVAASRSSKAAARRVLDDPTEGATIASYGFDGVRELRARYIARNGYFGG